MTYVYMIEDKNNRLYIVVSDNPKKRLYDHNHQLGAIFTKEGSFRIVFLEKYLTLKEARTREVQIKKWRRDKKEVLIDRYKNRLETK